ncbi:surface antigen [Plasmodium falciparum UGT5.1]|uniref:Surface antigen n=1 Tax=Plasmodium falciparum UGT5.1 TaxID=1237627 RepID=W7JWG8_PLAFA|nr:surface antigen [Plasmodium falciparum UGT5.1]
MKLHFPKILLFFFPLNILLTSYHVYSKNKPSITPHHTPITTSRVLSESDPYMLNYDNDDDMKSVKENFERQTSQRFEEYEERVKDKRQKCKEQRDKDIQKIIVKDKMEKNLAEKVEKGCLKCGCALGGGVLPVWGLVGGLWYASWTHFVATTVAKAATDAGVKKAIEGLGEIYGLSTLPGVDIPGMVNAGNFQNIMHLIKSVMRVQNNFCTSGLNETNLFCSTEVQMTSPVFTQTVTQSIRETVEVAGQAAKMAEVAEAAEFLPKTTILTNTIIASVVAIIIIALVMIIIYLVLRYRRKKKMNKKQQYTKLLNQ